MSGDRQPQPGDRVRVTLEGEYRAHDERAEYHVINGSDGLNHTAPLTATVEVLQPADDPVVGELRREDHTPDVGHSIWQVEENERGVRYWRCTFSTASGNRGCEYTIEDQDMLTFPVIGAVPGTPAADKGVGLPMHTSQQQWETDDLELAGDPHEPVVLKRADTAPLPDVQPRTFTADGPPPPADVDAVRDRDGSLLSRVTNELWIGEGGWADGKETYPNHPKPWNQHTLPKYEPYTEVLS